MDNIIICQPEKNEYDDIFRMINKIANESNQFTFTSDDIGMDEKLFAKYISDFKFYKNSIFLLAKKENKIVGFAYLDGGKRERTHHNANLGIGIIKEYRGLGIGKLLISKLVNFAKESEYIAKIDLQVRFDNPVAIKLYKSFNFNIEGINKRALFIDGDFVNYANMGLLID